MKLFGLFVLSVMLATSFASFVVADEGNALEATASATGVFGTATASADASEDDAATEPWETIRSRCIVASANGIKTIAAGCAVKYCNRPVTSAAEFEKCAKIRASTGSGSSDDRPS